MTDPLSRPCTAFRGTRRLAAGPLRDVVLAVKAAADAVGQDGGTQPLLTFDDATGRVLDFDLRGGPAAVLERLTAAAPAQATAQAPPQAEAPDGPRGRGRPRLGVVAREVTLLPRHWDWLAAQPGGASAALRRLVEAARRAEGEAPRRRSAREAAYRVMAALAGDLPGFEEAARALFADDRAAFDRRTAGWPADVRGYVVRLGWG